MLLALDTSTHMIGLAFFDGVQILHESVWKTINHHSVEIAPAVDAALRKAGLKPGELRCIAVAKGPGSFTSLRIGMAVAKGMALGLNVPIVAVPTLDILAAGVALRPTDMGALLQAGRNRLAIQWYRPGRDAWEAKGELAVASAHDLVQHVIGPTFFAGELSAQDRQTLARRWKNVSLAEPVECVRRPANLAKLGWDRWQAGLVEDANLLSPIYLHMAGAAAQ